jgi:undecaprenyl-diphosphatase
MKVHHGLMKLPGGRETLLGRRILAAMVRHDGALLDFICARRRNGLSRVMILATRAGDARTYLLLGAVAILVGGPFGRALAAAAATGGLASVSAYVLKRLIARPRPACASPLRVPLVAPPDAWSFPSGHTAAAVAAACAIGASLGPAAACIAILACTLIGVSRVYVGAHYPLDVLMGAGLGVAVHAALGDAARALALLLPTVQM